MARPWSKRAGTIAKGKQLFEATQSRLNVIFHGPFVFVFYRDRVEVLATENQAHVVGIGDWQSERPCKPGAYRLNGVKEQGSIGGRENQTHVIIDAEKLKLRVAQESHYQFVLPNPIYMTALGWLDPGNQTMFIGGHVRMINIPTKIGSAHVLSYILDKNDMPQMENVYWNSPRIPTSGPGIVINLHIFAESPFMLDEFHPNRDFARTMAMLSGLSLGISRPFPNVKFKLNPNAIVLGIEKEEQGGLRGLPSRLELVPPRICDAPSLVVINASTSV